MAFAGIFGVPADQTGMTCAIITCPSNETVAPIHDRMPVIVPRKAFGAWLNPENHDTRALVYLLKPCPEELLETYPVSRAVNKPENDGPQLAERME